jgi:putative transposase
LFGTDDQWVLSEPLLPPQGRLGQPRKHHRRDLVNACLYAVRTGCQWRDLPREYPPWGGVHWYFLKWRMEGVWQRIHDALREQVRMSEGRAATPSAAVIDSQSVKTTEKGALGIAATTPARR